MDPYRYIDKFIKFGTKGGYKPGLKRINTLLAAFDHPENKLKVIHVAGSNGKGSTIAFLKSIYVEAGYRVGVYTSPHLIEFNERIEINGQRISTEELSELVIKVKPVIDKVKNSELGEPSFFELVTTLAFLYFLQQKVDMVILETGLGGRLDATNIIKTPLISVITGISLEHTSILGYTVEEIAGEKAGIIKKGVSVVVGVRNKNALKVIEDIAYKNDSRLVKVNEKYDYIIKDSTLEGYEFSLKYKNLEDNRKSNGEEIYKIGLLGEHQVRNAILALEVVKELNSIFPAQDDEIRKGLLNAYISGRMEVIRKRPLIFLDGAHNSEGIGEAVKFLEQLRSKMEQEMFKRGKIYLVLAVFGDKDINKMLQKLICLQNIEVIISENSNTRALSAEIIKENFVSYNVESRVILPLEKAVKTAIKEASINDIILIIGSLYNTAEVKKTLIYPHYY